MNDIVIESEGGIVISTEQWNGDLFITIADGPEIAYEAKSILLATAQVRKLADWLNAWLAEKEE